MDAAAAGLVSPAATNVRSAINRLRELEPQLEGIARSATPEQVQQLNLLTGRANTALSEGARMYNQWVNSPASAMDPHNISLSERFFRQLGTTVGVTGAAERITGRSAHQLWETTGAHVEQAAQEEAERAAAESVWGVQATTGPKGTGPGGRPGNGDGPSRWQLGFRDKLAIVGVGAIGLTALYIFLKVKRAIPFV
jgi:hypothetical protein